VRRTYLATFGCRGILQTDKLSLKPVCEVSADRQHNVSTERHHVCCVAKPVSSVPEPVDEVLRFVVGFFRHFAETAFTLYRICAGQQPTPTPLLKLPIHDDASFTFCQSRVPIILTVDDALDIASRRPPFRRLHGKHPWPGKRAATWYAGLSNTKESIPPAEEGSQLRCVPGKKSQV
jgi:hypothetical protein